MGAQVPSAVSPPTWEQALTQPSLNRGTWEGPRVSTRLSSSSRFARQTKHMLTNKKLNLHSHVVHGGSAIGLGSVLSHPRPWAPPVGGSAFSVLKGPGLPRRPSGSLISSPFCWLMGKETLKVTCVTTSHGIHLEKVHTPPSTLHRVARAPPPPRETRKCSQTLSPGRRGDDADEAKQSVHNAASVSLSFPWEA